MSVFKPQSTIPLTFKQKVTATITMLLCAIGVLIISQTSLINNSLRLDESQSLWQSSHSLSGTLHTVALDVHVPLYHLILHFWIFYFGNGVDTVRSLSMIFFLATLPVMFLLARQLLSFRWALFTTVLFSFLPFMNWYANEARMYTLLVLLATLSQYYYLKILRENKGWWAYAITAMIGVYAHYFFAFNLAAQAIFYLVYRNSFAKGSFKKFAAIAVAAVASLSPWLYYVYSLGSASNTRPNLPSPSTVDFFNVYSQFMFGFQDDRINTIILSCWPLIMAISLLALRRNQKLTPEVSYVASMAIIPILLAFVVSLIITPFFVSRYMISCVAGLLLLTVWLVSRYPRKISSVLATLMVAVVVITSFHQNTSASTPVKEDYKTVADYLNVNAKPQDLIVLSSPFTIYPFEYYYNGSAQIQTLPQWDRVSTGAIPAFDAKTLPQQVENQNKHHRYIYLLLSQDQGYQEEIEQYYLTHFKQISKEEYSPDLTLYVYQVGYYTVPTLEMTN